MANNLRQGVNNKLILANGGILRNDVRGSLTVVTTTTASVSRYLSLRSFLGSVSVAATTATTVRLGCRCSLGLMSVPTAAAPSV